MWGSSYKVVMGKYPTGYFLHHGNIRNWYRYLRLVNLQVSHAPTDLCLLGTRVKALKRLIYNKLLPIIESQRGRSDQQYGFRKTRLNWFLARPKVQFTERILPVNIGCEKWIQFGQLEPNTKILIDCCSLYHAVVLAARRYDTDDELQQYAQASILRAVHRRRTSYTTVYLIIWVLRKARWWVTPIT